MAYFFGGVEPTKLSSPSHSGYPDSRTKFYDTLTHSGKNEQGWAIGSYHRTGGMHDTNQPSSMPVTNYTSDTRFVTLPASPCWTQPSLLWQYHNTSNIYTSGLLASWTRVLCRHDAQSSKEPEQHSCSVTYPLTENLRMRSATRASAKSYRHSRSAIAGPEQRWASRRRCRVGLFVYYFGHG
jgi:hypothetical protein